MENDKKGRTLERATRMLHAGLGALAGGYVLLGFKDISTYDTDHFRYTFEPTATSGVLAGMATAGAIAYAGVSRLMKRFERKTLENPENERQEIRAKGFFFAAPLIGAGLAGAAYNHDAAQIPHLDPTPVIQRLPESITLNDPERRRNLRFLTKHVIMPDLSDLSTEAIAKATQPNWQDRIHYVPDPTDPTLTVSRSEVELFVHGTPAVLHTVYTNGGVNLTLPPRGPPTTLYGAKNGIEYLTLGDKTLLLMDHSMAEHPDRYRRAKFMSCGDAHLLQKKPDGKPESGDAEPLLLLRAGHNALNKIAFTPLPAPPEGALHTYLQDDHRTYGDLTITDIETGETKIDLHNIIAPNYQDRPEGMPKAIRYAKEGPEGWNVYIIDLETLENRLARPKDNATWGWEELGPIEAPR